MTARADGGVSSAHDGGLYVSDGGVVSEWHCGDLIDVEDDVEAVRERDAAAGGDERLGFDRFVAVARVQQRWPDSCPVKDVID